MHRHHATLAAKRQRFAGPRETDLGRGVINGVLGRAPIGFHAAERRDWLVRGRRGREVGSHGDGSARHVESQGRSLLRSQVDSSCRCPCRPPSFLCPPPGPLSSFHAPRPLLLFSSRLAATSAATPFIRRPRPFAPGGDDLCLYCPSCFRSLAFVYLIVTALLPLGLHYPRSRSRHLIRPP